MKTIDGFRGEYRFLSNFWPCYLTYDGLVYPTTEHAYQAAKIEDHGIKASIRDCHTPAEAKEYLGKHNIKTAREWTIEKKLSVMEELQMIKFGGKEPLLTRALLATGDAKLVEANTWNDTFWGVCNNTGENHLGRILMNVRMTLLEQKDQIIQLLKHKEENIQVAKVLSVTQKDLYERMNAFSIQNKEYWIS